MLSGLSNTVFWGGFLLSFSFFPFFSHTYIGVTKHKGVWGRGGGSERECEWDRDGLIGLN